MIRATLISLILFTSLFCYANDAFHQGVKQFQEKQFAEAVLSFEQAIKEQPNNSTAYFNLGLAYNGNKQYGNAIWAFERVIRLVPNDAEALENIELNYAELENNVKWKQELNRFDRSMYSFSSDTWAIIAIIFSLLGAGALIFFKKTKSLPSKRILLLLSLSCFIVMAFSIYIARGSYNYALNTKRYAIITVSSVETYKDAKPTPTDPTGIQLHEGEKIQVIQHFKGDMFEVEKNDGTRYFITNQGFKYL